jgi:uncharacterized peroxidase-related enzyme
MTQTMPLPEPLLPPLPADHTPELKPFFDFFLTTLGFVPNSVLTMQRKPRLVQAFVQLNAAVMDPRGRLDLGLRRLIGHVASRAAGCNYCMAHTALGASNFGIAEEKLAALWNYATSPLYSDAERAALDFALAAASVPNAVDAALTEKLKRFFDEEEIVEMLAVVAMFGFLNRWNDSIGTPLEARAGEMAERTIAAGGWQRGKH